ncbi:MFS transporter [Methylobacterium sp. 13MFTsu3.1M2]|uniref:MFS transporter n=2 Tax=Methylobacteriaceae TaxID=119045 RepID=UPI0008ECADDB|nr:MFS transporter [Methylobacterium sp. 13MFTsu3.1M2]SFF07220.1 Predicted arabinose efflux permease, MFS family [Methylobacterium sp. 13MFTsu3.1M2]
MEQDIGEGERPPASRRPSVSRSLDLLNLLLIDVNGAIKPYLNVYLYVHRGWNDASVGLVSTVSGIVGIVVQTPIGTAIDAVRDKRVILLGALVALSLATLLVALFPYFWPVLAASCVLAAVGGMLSPAIATLTLGLFPSDRIAGRFGRNAALERTGNVAIAVLIGLVGWLFPDRAVFLLVPACAIVSAAALYSIPRDAIDARRARGGGEGEQAPARWRTLLTCRPLMVFAACVGLFHFANAPLLTLVAQEIGQARPDWSSVIVSVCIVGAQGVMVPMGLIVGRRAERWGRKPLLVIGFAALPVRALLYLVWRDPYWLIAVQCLDGVGAGLLSAVKPLVIADITRGTGRYNAAHGLIGTVQGAGASLSFVIAGTLVQQAGFDAAYLACAAVAAVALGVLVTLLPETIPEKPRRSPGAARRRGCER